MSDDSTSLSEELRVCTDDQELTEDEAETLAEYLNWYRSR